MQDSIPVSFDDTEFDRFMIGSMFTEDELKMGIPPQKEEIAPDVWFVWGVQDGKVEGYLHQEGLEVAMDWCKKIREDTSGMSKAERVAQGYAEDYIIPMGLREAMKFEGIDVDGIVMSGDPAAWEPIDRIMETKYPAFKLTDRVIWRPKKQKQLFKA